MKYLKKTKIGTKIGKYMGISDKYKFRQDLNFIIENVDFKRISCACDSVL